LLLWHDDRNIYAATARLSGLLQSNQIQNMARLKPRLSQKAVVHGVARYSPFSHCCVYLMLVSLNRFPFCRAKPTVIQKRLSMHLHCMADVLKHLRFYLFDWNDMFASHGDAAGAEPIAQLPSRNQQVKHFGNGSLRLSSPYGIESGTNRPKYWIVDSTRRVHRNAMM